MYTVYAGNGDLSEGLPFLSGNLELEQMCPLDPTYHQVDDLHEYYDSDEECEDEAAVVLLVLNINC